MHSTLRHPIGEPLDVETALEQPAPGSNVPGSTTPESAASTDVPRKRLPNWATVCEASVFVVFAVFFILYGVTPIFGGDGIGLVGADEPRYAQIAHEMLDRFDSAHTLKERLSACVTPYLYGHPWLEKPALYYWRAMFVFQDFGVHDWSARLPSASFAFIMVALIYLHMRRFRRGGHLDAALITVACAGIIGFSRGASTDMQMAAPFSIGLLGWYAWYETDSKFWLFDIYFFTGVATLAKGPVAPFLAILIVVAFAALRREWSILKRSFWWPGVVLYFAIVLPWFVAVQHQNPTFFREFFLEHNLERFATNRYEHQQPFWYYLVVVLLALMPWTVIAIRALVDGIQTSVAEWRLRHSKPDKPAPKRPGDAFPEFLVLWTLIPIIFFSFSQSKLPGYILPGIPALLMLGATAIHRRAGWEEPPRRVSILLHAALLGVLGAALIVAPRVVFHIHLTAGVLAAAAAAFAVIFLLVALPLVRLGWPMLRFVTLLPMILLVGFLLRGLAPALDATVSSRPVAQWST